ncbi:MAG: xanthine dehydrogenase family protein molybdopterin-binding subunit [Betaproteobacteria bacterium]|nr:xanthine dehydrogenase family protein molybdopterin-binding subunit [Betaproteobacteria bacterium]MBV9362474.1 xanthine dehydrogenase family protein molybdopterin-binding subunit [Betaproteobacteria bacterium]
MIENVSRREFFKTSGALVLAVALPDVHAQAQAPLEPNAFIRIGADSTVTVIVKHLEMGQGTYTGLPTLVAEELDADWAQMRVEGAPADAKRYNNLFWGEAQGTGGSSSLPNSYEQLRKAGAAARFMLVGSAAERWKVPAKDITIAKGVVMHKKTGRRAKFGDLVAGAMTQVVPADVPLKDPKDFVYIGKGTQPRTDARAKSTGTAIYTQDIKLPSMLTAVVLHPPRFGAKLKSFDAAKTKSIPGVVNVVQFSTAATNGVAVLAKDYWTAKKGRDALTADWDETGALRLSSADIMADYKRLAPMPGTVAHKSGDIEPAMKGAAKTVEAAYEFPFLAHAAMEPMNCVVALGAEGCEIWNGEQFQTVDQMMIAQLVDLKPEQVKLNMLYAGGSFGRRANPHSDYLLEAAAIAKANGEQRPIKLVWGREDDMRAGYYRPMYYHELEAGLDDKGELIAWRHTIVGQSILTGTAFEGMMVKDGVDATSVEGAANLPYAVPNRLLELHSPKLAVPVQWWRSVGSTHTAYATECFLDEVARATGKDPYALRRALLAQHPRHLAALDLAAKQAGWGKPLGKDRARGIAVHESFDTVVAQVVEVSRQKDSVHIDRVVCAVDCGVAVNPHIVAMQMESGIGYGLSAALAGAITLKEGVVEQSNFHDYPVVRMNQMPKIEVHIVPSTAKPTGVGEPATPVIAPALANALAALNGSPLRSLPLKEVNFS